MGRIALFMILALAVSLGIIGYSINQSKTGIVQNVAGFQKYTMARNIAHTAINMAFRALDRNDSSFINTRRLTVNIFGGNAVVTFQYDSAGKVPSLQRDTMLMYCTSSFMDTTRYMSLRLRRAPVPFPVVNQALGLRVENVNFKIKDASSNIDGRDHDMNGNVLPPSANDRPGVAVYTPSDTIKVINEENNKPGEQILGTRDVIHNPALPDPALFVDEYISAADRVFTSANSPLTSNQTWGSPTTPVIVFCDGDIKITGTINGWGILVVRGNLTITGNFTFRGLVIAYQEALIDQVTLGTGTPTIIGGMLMAGPPGSSFEMRGNSQISYSSTAITMAKYINKLQGYRVMRWYE